MSSPSRNPDLVHTSYYPRPSSPSGTHIAPAPSGVNARQFNNASFNTNTYAQVTGGNRSRASLEGQVDAHSISKRHNNSSQLIGPKAHSSNDQSNLAASLEADDTKHEVDDSRSPAQAPEKDFYFDPSLPMTSAVQAHYRKELKDAMKDLSNCEDDTKHTTEGGMCQAMQMLEKDYWPGYAFDEAARNLLQIVHMSQNNGPQQPKYGKYNYSDKFATVHGRLAHVIDNLKRSKAMVKNVMDCAFIYRLCDDPAAEMKRKLANKTGNRRKTIQVKAGKLALKDKGSDDEEDGDAQDAEDARDEPGQEAQNSEDTEETQPPVSSEATATQSTKRKGTPSPEALASAKRQRIDTEDSTMEFTGTSTSSGPQQHSVTRDHTSIDPSNKPTSCHIAYGQSSPCDMELLLARTPSPSPDLIRELSNDYGAYICRILQVPERYSNQNKLEHLRIYARAYNAEMEDIPWYYDQMPAEIEYGLGQFFYKSDGTSIHFLQLMPKSLQSLALEREKTSSGEIPGPRGGSMWKFERLGGESKRVLGLEANYFKQLPGIGFEPLDPRQSANLPLMN